MEQEIGLTPASDEMLLDLTSIEPTRVDYRVADIAEIDVQPISPAFPGRGASTKGLPAADLWQLAVKRSVDILVGALAILLLTPLLLTVAFLVRATSRGPIFYVQQRVGRSGEPFNMLKFRSMYVDAHDRRHEHMTLNMHQGPIFKIRDDPRVTRVGRAIRRLSIDELPQLFNVLTGHMSLVGPRPALPEEVIDYTERERQRLLVKPGVTCIWQVSGRSDLDFHTWVDMDLAYIESWSLRLDLKLLVKTVPAVLSGRGAY